MKSSMVMTALKNAVRSRHPAETVVHSDRGSQFRSHRLVESLRHHGRPRSMGRVGACADDAAMESFFSLLQKNVRNRHRWLTRQEIRLEIYHLAKGSTTAGDAKDASENPHPSNI